MSLYYYFDLGLSSGLKLGPYDDFREQTLRFRTPDGYTAWQVDANIDLGSAALF